jgi:hypothetical protein
MGYLRDSRNNKRLMYSNTPRDPNNPHKQLIKKE